MSGTVRDRVIAILAEQALLDVSDVHPTSTLADLGIESLGLVEAIFAIEESFGITVPLNVDDPSRSSFDLSSVATVVAAVERLVAERAE